MPMVDRGRVIRFQADSALRTCSRGGCALKVIGFVMLLVASFCFAQDSSDFKPATSNVLDAQYPRVDSKSRVQIRFKAPDAAKVKLNFWSGPKVDMEKQADGFWTVTTPPMAPGLHYYTIIVDGAEVSDPASTAYFGGSKWASAVEVPEAGVDLLPAQRCPAWAGASALVSLQCDRNVAGCICVFASGLRHADEDPLPCALSTARRRRGRDRLDPAG